MTKISLPPLHWLSHEGAGQVADSAVTLTAPAGTDWTNDAMGAPPQHAAPALVFDSPAELALSARVRVTTGRTTFDAGALVLWADDTHWAKLCFEQAPNGRAMVVSTVTNEYTDDCNSWDVDDETVHLRIVRTGPAWAFHASRDGETWEFVRLFRLYSDRPVRVGFLAQAPLGTTCTAVFDRIVLDDTAPGDLRDGS